MRRYLDGVVLESASRESVSVPIDPKVMAMTARKKTTRTPPPSVPAPSICDEVGEIPESVLLPADGDEALTVSRDSLSETPEGLDEGDAEVQGKEGVSIEKADRSLSELHRWYRNGRLVIDPEW